MTDESAVLPADEEQTPFTLDVAGIDGAASILEQLLLDDGFPFDRGLLRRVVRETAAAFPGEASQVWWRWIGEAGTNLGLKCKVVDCTLSELRELARDDARLIMYVSGPNPWRAVTGARGRKFRLARALTEKSSQWFNASQLNQFVGNPGTQTVLRCVIVERFVDYGDPARTHAEVMSPLARLWALLRPERSDML